MDKHKLLSEFLKTWPIERLRSMTLEEYTNLNRQDSFCYWLEQRTNELGGITGGSSFKFGIYKRNNTDNEITISNALTDGEYAWFQKYGDSKEEAFHNVRNIIVQIAEFATSKEFDKIEEIDFGESTKWKIAFLYSEFQLINTFSKDMVCSILDFLNIEYSKDESRFSLSQKILSQKKEDEDFFEFGSKFWNVTLISQELKRILENLGERLIPYFDVMDRIVEDFNLEPNNEKYYFNYRNKELIFTIGQRYVWNVSKNSYRYISLENRTDNAEVFASSKNVPEAYLNHITEISTTDDIFNYMKNAIELELKSTVKSSFRKNNKADFQEMVFNRVFRDRVLNSLNISGTTIVNQSNIQMNQLPSIPLNQILYGPPGTGKTFNTINKAIEIANPNFDINQERSLVKAEYNRLVNTGQIVFTTFHQSMSYEDFVEGIKPLIEEDADGNKTVVYEIKDGIFKKITKEAKQKHFKENSEISSLTFEDAWALLVEEGNNRLENKDQLLLPIQTPNKGLKIVDITERGNLKLKPIYSEESKEYIVSYSRTEKLHTAFPDLSVVKNIDKEFRSVIGGSNSTAYWAVLNYINNKLNSQNKSNSQIEVLAPKSYVLIIDEINRGNVSQIFGELITLIEEDKRIGKSEELYVTLPYSKEKFGVPSNLYIIGTMNTADRSVEAIDTALRRRFSFEEMPPRYDLEGLQYTINGIQAWEILKTINARIESLIDRDHAIGHAYFLNKNEEAIMDSFYRNIIPLLQEYFFGDYGKIGLVLGKGFVRVKDETVKFAHFNYEGFDFDPKETYEIIDYRKDNDQQGFLKAISMLMNRSVEE